MKAARIHAYGGPDVLTIEEVDKPTPGPRDLLIRVVAASVNPVDWKLRSGGQRNIVRYKLPWILGLDCSGVVEAVGAKVTKFKVGDEVFSSPTHSRPGTYAEYVCIDQGECAKKPKNMSHEEAASIPLVGLTAYQCLVEKGKLAKGQTVLIHAGSGGVGAFAIQLAKHLGAHVVTTCSGKNDAFVRELGADQVIDYTKDKFEDVVHDVDLVLDSMGEPAFDGNIAVLRRGGRLSNIILDVPSHVKKYGTFFSLFTLAAAMIWLHVWPRLKKGIKVRHVIKRCDGEQLAKIAELCEVSAIKAPIDEVFSLEQIRDAHRRSETGRARGKIVVKIADA